MLCEQCNNREATVHVTDTSGSSGRMTKHHYCETYFQPAVPEIKIESFGWTSYDKERVDDSKDSQL